jgi:hypothetical protein
VARHIFGFARCGYPYTQSNITSIVFHFLALYFETIALLLANKNWKIFHGYFYIWKS